METASEAASFPLAVLANQPATALVAAADAVAKAVPEASAQAAMKQRTNAAAVVAVPVLLAAAWQTWQPHFGHQLEMPHLLLICSLVFLLSWRKLLWMVQSRLKTKAHPH